MRNLWVVLFVVIGLSCVCAQAGEVEIVSWESAGRLVFNESTNAASYRVEWASSLDGPWQDFSLYAEHGLDFIRATGNGAVTTAVPMFYRVVALEIERSPISMIHLAGGTFQMGNQSGAEEGAYWELPVRTITLDPLYIGETPVTEAQWRPVYNWALENGYEFDYLGSAKGPDYPIAWINWFDIVKWCNAKSEIEGLIPCYYVDGDVVYKKDQRDDLVCVWTNSGFRLPTEAEWEYAARGGTTTRFPWGDRISNETNANYTAQCTNGAFVLEYDDGPYCGTNPEFKTGMFFLSPVRAYPTNNFGLYDVIGNAMEWVWDWMSFTYYEEEQEATNPRGPATGSMRAIRGANYLMPANVCRVSYRIPNPHYMYSPASSFRVVLRDDDL